MVMRVLEQGDFVGITGGTSILAVASSAVIVSRSIGLKTCREQPACPGSMSSETESIDHGDSSLH